MNGRHSARRIWEAQFLVLSLGLAMSLSPRAPAIGKKGGSRGNANVSCFRFWCRRPQGREQVTRSFRAIPVNPPSLY
jgi:hypothetical protein